MKNHHLKGMVRALRSVLKDSDKAQVILERYWHDRKAIVWELRDVHQAANERDLVLTDDQACKIFDEFLNSYNRHDPELGVNWLRLLAIIDESCLGRKITRQELKRFLKQNIIATERITHAQKARHTGHR
jgi:hypothetical protein